MYSLTIYVFFYHLRIQQLSFILTTKHHLNKVNKIFSLWIVDGIKLKKYDLTWVVIKYEFYERTY